MPRALSISGIVVAILLILVFGLDVALGFPFGGASKTMDIGFCIAALLLGYLSWSTLRELP
ncbi:MAG TPA: hypothetical protein VHD36_11270 [Pirellulales bacterium]|nr:hypothetical protein [Pirellulales bacterium]